VSLLQFQKLLNDAFEDKFGFYIYDKEADQMVTLGTWIRFAETGQKYYFGGIVDYHY